MKHQFILRTKREEKGISQSELAEVTGISLTSIGRYETQQRIPNVFAAYRLAKALSCSIEDMITVSEE